MLSALSQQSGHAHQNYEPTTPSSHRGSSPMSSPTSSPTFRRTSQYKATTTPLLSSASRRKSSASAYAKKPNTSHWDGSFMRGNLFGTEPQAEPQNNAARERFKRQCFERAQRAREAKVRSGRKSAVYSSEGEDLDMDMDEEGEDGFINDEYYARIVLEAERKRDYQYRLSFEHDVGSSFDPAMEDPVEWEQDLKAGTSATVEPRPPSEFDEDEAAELAALAEDEAYWEALGNTDDLDNVDVATCEANAPSARRVEDDMDMDMS
ncbi:unnamed protein product [Peniophora sp. CBMAI 1063]|nr:unnamed protein product [Peniophora sp. CBMAI 1063]